MVFFLIEQHQVEQHQVERFFRNSTLVYGLLETKSGSSQINGLLETKSGSSFEVLLLEVLFASCPKNRSVVPLVLLKPQKEKKRFFSFLNTKEERFLGQEANTRAVLQLLEHQRRAVLQSSEHQSGSSALKRISVFSFKNRVFQKNPKRRSAPLHKLTSSHFLFTDSLFW